MKSLSLFAIAGLAAVGVSGAEVADIKIVYLMPMSRGLDQFLAQRLSAHGIVQVVTDPQKAEAIFTDRVGANFEESLTQLLQGPVQKVEKQDDTTYTRPAMQPLSRGKGNVFLIDIASKSVVWSAFVPPKTTDAKDMNKVADEIADQFAKSRKKK